MRIVDSLRQEHMPDMVYTLCKFVGNKRMKHDDVMKYITLNDSEDNEKSRQNFSQVYSFSKDCGFILVEPDGTIVSAFEKKDLENFRKFRYRVFVNVMDDLNTDFTGLVKWILNQDKSFLSSSKPNEIIANVPSNYTITMNYVRGFYFWIEALGLVNILETPSRRIYFATHEILRDWLRYEKPFKKGERILFRNFVSRLLEDCPIFEEAFRDNRINFALSGALRILSESNQIELIYTKDSGDMWNLYNSNAYQSSNQVTELEVK